MAASHNGAATAEAMRGALLESVVGTTLSDRLAEELGRALRRKPATEGLLAAAVEVLLPFSEVLTEAAVAAVDVMVRRGTLDRPLCTALFRGLVERRDSRADVALGRALESESVSLSLLTSAALTSAPVIGPALAHWAKSRVTHIAFAAEVARATRRDSQGERLSELAPRLKESHRIELLATVLRPLVGARAVICGSAQALAILRDSERHLGRWLCLAEGAKLAGDTGVVEEAKKRAASGALPSRTAYRLLAWALGPAQGPCESRPTLELVARLSDRPSSERDLSFLFRMADGGLPSAKPMLSALAEVPMLDNELALRASAYLVRDHGERDHLRRLTEVGRSARYARNRGLALAGLYEIDPSLLQGIGLELDRARHPGVAAWSALVRMALASDSFGPVLTESRFRVLQRGWPD